VLFLLDLHEEIRLKNRHKIQIAATITTPIVIDRPSGAGPRISNILSIATPIAAADNTVNTELNLKFMMNSGQMNFIKESVVINLMGLDHTLDLRLWREKRP